MTTKKRVEYGAAFEATVDGIKVEDLPTLTALRFQVENGDLPIEGAKRLKDTNRWEKSLGNIVLAWEELNGGATVKLLGVRSRR